MPTKTDSRRNGSLDCDQAEFEDPCICRCVEMPRSPGYGEHYALLWRQAIKVRFENRLA